MSESPTPDSRQTRVSLLARLHDDQDAASWQTFVGVYAPLIYGFARRRGLQDADANDITQEVLIEVARGIRGFEYDRGKGRFRDWLGLVTRRRLSRFFARLADWPGRLPAAIADPGLDAEWAAAFDDRLFEAAMERVQSQFTDPTWQAFTRTWLKNEPAQAVAESLGMTVDALYVARSRVLKSLREEVLELAEDVPRHV